jgi:hypothetical protein
LDVYFHSHAIFFVLFLLVSAGYSRIH